MANNKYYPDPLIHMFKLLERFGVGQWNEDQLAYIIYVTYVRKHTNHGDYSGQSF